MSPRWLQDAAWWLERLEEFLYYDDDFLDVLPTRTRVDDVRDELVELATRLRRQAAALSAVMP
ncbi:MAG: hypothetical protein M3326_15995 [Actinomycetota bacterium]|nr:hypothetical protein [Actinomycetota bacterium]